MYQMKHYKDIRAGRIPKDQLSRVYEPSWQANAVNLAGSVAAPMLVAPLFYPQQQANINQYVTQQQQLGQQEMLNQMYQAQTADGTLYQTQGLPERY
jgi:type IV secretory pathway TrbF-like protein